jgi:hypothetical protein
MNFLGMLEIVDRGGHVLHRVRVEHLPFRIGRALDNELVLDDPYACAHHAEINTDADADAGLALTLVDLGSVNGTFVGSERQRRERIELGTAADLRLGHTQLRFRGVQESLPATIPDPLASSRWLALDRLSWGASALIACAVAVTIDNVVGSPKALNLGAIAGAAAPALVVLALWALAWSLVNRVIAHRFHYLGHLTIGGAAVLVGSLIEMIGSYGGFAFAWDDALPLFGSISGALLVSAVIFGHLRLISRGAARALLLPSALVGVAFLALVLLPGAGDDRFSSEPSFSGSLKTPFAALAAGKDSASFYADAQATLDEVDLDQELGAEDKARAAAID